MFNSSGKRRESALVEMGDGTSSASSGRRYKKVQNPMPELTGKQQAELKRRTSALVQMGDGTTGPSMRDIRQSNPMVEAERLEMKNDSWKRRPSALVDLGHGNGASARFARQVDFSNPMLDPNAAASANGRRGRRGSLGSISQFTAEVTSSAVWGTSKATGARALCGWLHKLGHAARWNQEWKRRFFVLSGGDLDFFADEEQTKLKGSIDLTKATNVQVFNTCFRLDCVTFPSL
jgi:hypothetical protein